MDFLSFDYRDPLYGAILLIAIIFIISFTSYWWGIIKNKEEESSVNKFMKKFDQYSGFNEYKEIIQKKDLPTESAILMALTFEKSGEYEKTIEIYSAILKSVKEPQKRKDILTLLGKTYYKAGFLQKSREVLLASLKLFPRNEEALTYLIVIYENLREYDKALEVLDTLEALGSEVKEKKLYFEILSIIHNKSLKNEKKIKKLIDLGLDKKIVQRKLFEFLKLHNLNMDNSILKNFDFQNIIDMVWDMRADRFDPQLIENNQLLAEIFSAKGEIYEATSSDIFELNTLIKLHLIKDNSADMGFRYTCKECKSVFPLYFYRCPKCQNISGAEIDTILIKRQYETGSLV
ncbi:MAG: tetratricopeptide repeat protein [Epsilonproteobacteria bacterium]|nr:tetratricopeptide repeat protein [Campylobacterota bacterium]